MSDKYEVALNCKLLVDADSEEEAERKAEELMDKNGAKTHFAVAKKQEELKKYTAYYTVVGDISCTFKASSPEEAWKLAHDYSNDAVVNGYSDENWRSTPEFNYLMDDNDQEVKFV